MNDQLIKVIFLSLIILYSLILIAVAILFFIRANQKKLRNLIYGSIALIIPAITQLFENTINLSSAIYILIIRVGLIFEVFFINRTFHEGKEKHASRFILTITSVLIVINVILYYFRDISLTPELYYVSTLINILLVSVVYGWMAWSSYFSYKIIKNRGIEPWIKARYKIFVFSSILFMFRPIGQLIRPWDYEKVGYYTIELLVGALVSILITLIASIVLLFVWYMPKGLKNRLNKNYAPNMEDKRETTELINYLGDLLSEKTGLTPQASRGMIKLAIKDQFGSFTRLEQITLNSIMKVIENSLCDRIEKIQQEDKFPVKNVNVNELIDDLKNNMIIGQAIITMANV